jgi:dolichyl-phosphate-mannose--protein O-mannosyl transferase
LIAVVALAAGLRTVALARPRTMVWDENFYVPDACSYLQLSTELCGQARESGFVHPPLGTWLIALGVELFGYEPIGWRATAVLAGIATVLATYLLGRAMDLSRWAALLAAALLALDPLHVVFSRAATLDVFVTLVGVLMILTAVRSVRAGARAASWVWRPLTGLLVGAAVATKWSAVLLLPLTVLILVMGDARRHAHMQRPSTTRQRLAQALSWVGSAALPVAVYVICYAGRLDTGGSVWSYHGFLRQLVRRQESMLRFHLGLETDLGSHSYASPAWSWPLAWRPPVVAFDISGDHVQETLGLVNPLVLVPALCLSGWIALKAARRRRAEIRSVAALAALSCWLPWVGLAWDRSFVFAYYMLPAVPFLAIVLAQGVAALHERRHGAGTVVGCSVLAISVALVAWFWPLLTSGPLTYDDWRKRILFERCGGDPPRMPDDRLGPAVGEAQPPEGWCWL